MKNERATYRLSVIVPCFRAEPYLGRCLDSLLHQTLEDMEIICVNDGSPDNTLVILRDYQRRYGRKIVVIDKPNEGVWKARRDGIFAASGEYIGFLDPDDYAHDGYAGKLYDTAVRYGADIACCGYDRIDSETGKPYSREMTGFPYTSFNIQEEPGLMLEVNPALWNKIFRSELIREMFEIPDIPPVLDDLAFAQLIYIRAQVIAFVPESLVCYMVRQGSVITSIRPANISGVYKAAKEMRVIYQHENPEMLDYLDGAAFLHLGISFMYRLYGVKDFNRIFRNNMVFLDARFPRWRKNAYIRASYVISHKGCNKKLLTVRIIYGLHMWKPFLFLYRLMIELLKKDLKW